MVNHQIEQYSYKSAYWAAMDAVTTCEDSTEELENSRAARLMGKMMDGDENVGYVTEWGTPSGPQIRLHGSLDEWTDKVDHARAKAHEYKTYYRTAIVYKTTGGGYALTEHVYFVH